MRALRFLPLAFLANVDGFVLFAPYMVATVAVAHVIWAARRRREWAALAAPPADPTADGTPDLVPVLG